MMYSNGGAGVVGGAVRTVMDLRLGVGAGVAVCALGSATSRFTSHTRACSLNPRTMQALSNSQLHYFPVVSASERAYLEDGIGRELRQKSARKVRTAVGGISDGSALGRNAPGAVL